MHEKQERHVFGGCFGRLFDKRKKHIQMCFMKSDNNQEKKTFPINPAFSIEMVCLTVEPQNPQTNSYAKQFESCVYAFVVHSSLFTFCFLNHMTLF